MNRYARQIKLSLVNQGGQDKLLTSSVLIIGIGGLGCPVAQYLAGAGVGRIGLLDGDLVDLTNLHRQVLFTESNCGQPKATTAKNHLEKLNSSVEISAFDTYLTKENASAIVDEYDVIVDCTDNIPSRLLINDVCCELDKPWVYGGIKQFEGQVTVFNYNGGPTYRCLFPDSSSEEASCTEEGVLGPIAGIIGLDMSNEIIKLILGIGNLLDGKLKVYNMLNNSVHFYKFNRLSKPHNRNNNKGIHSISPLEVKSLLENNNVILLDVREAYEINVCSIKGSIHIPLSDIECKLDQIPNSDSPIIAYCHHGARSMDALKILKSKGYQNLLNLSGGIDQWSLTVDPTLPRY